MTGQGAVTAVTLVTSGALICLMSGCGSGTNASFAHAAARHTPSPKPSPSATAVPAPQGPFAVLVTNSARQGNTYDVLIVDTQGKVDARVTAQLPRVKPNATVDLPLVSASDTRAYYIDGDTDIRSLTPSGETALVKTIPEGEAAQLAFAVSPDDSRIAVAALTERSDATKDTSHGYIEILADGGNRLDVFNNIGAFAFRWPVGWHGQAVVDAVGSGGCSGYYCPPGYCPSGSCVSSYHVVDARTGNRTATLCETAAGNQTYGNSDYYAPVGAPSPAGTACSEDQTSTRSDGTTSDTQTIELIDWSGHEHAFLTKTATGGGADLGVHECFAAPDGQRLACRSETNNALQFVDTRGTRNDIGRRYAVLGWMDATHLLVGIDSGSVGVLDVQSGAVTTLALTAADKAVMATPLPGAL